MASSSATSPLDRDRLAGLAQLSPVEMEIMLSCLELGPATAREIANHHAKLSDETRDYRTVRTHITRLQEKGYLETAAPSREEFVPHRPSRLYLPIRSREEVLRRQILIFLESYIDVHEDGPEVLVRLLKDLGYPGLTDS